MFFGLLKIFVTAHDKKVYCRSLGKSTLKKQFYSRGTFTSKLKIHGENEPTVGLETVIIICQIP